MGKGNKPGLHLGHLEAGASKATVVDFSNATGWTRSLSFHNEADFLLDLTSLSPFGRLGEVVFSGALTYCADKRRATVCTMRVALVWFSDYLAWLTSRRDLSNDPRPKDITSALFSGFAAWLTNSKQSGRKLAVGSAAILYGYPASVFRLALAKYPLEFGPDFQISTNPLGHSSHFETLADRVQPLKICDYRAVQNAASRDALAILRDANRAPYPTTKDSLLPFHLLLLIRTCANPYPAAALGRNCLEAHPFEKGTWLIHFDKPRAGVGQNEDYPCFDFQ